MAALPLMLRAVLPRRARSTGPSARAGLQARIDAQQAARREAASRARRLDHDLRTPIGTLAAALALASGNADPDLQQEVQGVMQRQIGRLTGLAQELHALARQLGDEGASDAGPAAPDTGAPWDTR
ncbi:MAG: hypothetical protein EOO24_05915 [Comamonadaceae bacterium]|nr:MAG: hypothetical protein EOO24_05915 [Comamonadaceae bacterium]